MKDSIKAKKGKLTDLEKIEKENEALRLSEIILSANPNFSNEQIGKANLLVDTFVYLDKDDLVDSVGLEKGMAKVAELVKIFNDSIAKAKNENPELAQTCEKIESFSLDIQKAIIEKDYSKFDIIWHKFKSFVKKVFTLGKSKDAKEGYKQPLTNLMRLAFKEAYKNLRKEVEEKKPTKKQDPEM